MRHDLSEEIASVRNDLGIEITSVRHEVNDLRHDMEAMETRLTLATERMVHEAFAAQTRTLVVGLVAAFVLTALTNVLTVALG